MILLFFFIILLIINIREPLYVFFILFCIPIIFFLEDIEKDRKEKKIRNEIIKNNPEIKKKLDEGYLLKIDY